MRQHKVVFIDGVLVPHLSATTHEGIDAIYCHY
jgi:hypothetical protein